jgi:alpha-methylacyl-CoA racemase
MRIAPRADGITGTGVEMGPLEGLKVVEIAGIGPGPFCGMMLADMGADVVRIDRREAADLGIPVEPRFGVLGRGRRSITLDLKSPADLATLKALIAKADVLIEGFRPGVTERLGIGPAQCQAINPGLVYGRMTGWGQEGPMAKAAGHDLNYIALTGVLAAIGPANGVPMPPLNLVGDFGGGGMMLAMGVLAALYERARSGKGQVVDAAMVDGAAVLMSSIYGLRGAGRWTDRREDNILDGGAPWYGVYETADGRHVSIAAIEAKFYEEMLQKMGLADRGLPAQNDRSGWPRLKEVFTETFRSRTQAQWCEILEGSDACFAPVLTMGEAPSHPHMASRGTFVDVDGVTQPAPAPRFSRTPSAIRHAQPVNGQHGAEILRDWGVAGA